MTKTKISLNQLVGQLFQASVPPFKSKGSKDIKPTTIRPDANTAHFFKCHADSLGISMQDMMALTLNAVVATTTKPVRNELQLAVDRFRHIFEAHRIPQLHVKQIIDSYSDNSFPLGGLTNDLIFLENYSPSVQKALSDIFGVQESWLSGTGERVISIDPIYSRDYAFTISHQLKHPVQLKDITITNRSLLLVKSEADLGLYESDINIPFEVLFLTVIERQVDDYMRFKTFHLNGIFPLANTEARICLEALLKTVKEMEGSLGFQGASYPKDVITGIKHGLLPVDCFANNFPTLWDPSSLFPTKDNSKVNKLVEQLISFWG